MYVEGCHHIKENDTFFYYVYVWVYRALGIAGEIRCAALNLVKYVKHKINNLHLIKSEFKM